MTTENKKYLVYGGVALLVGSLGYFIYNAVTSKPIVVKNATDETKIINTTPTPAPKVNPFTALLGKKFDPITFKPTDYSVKNPFADVNTAIASVNPFSSTDTGERLV
jgi:hypothetical protein